MVDIGTRVVVVGAGQMGNGIGQVAATAGLEAKREVIQRLSELVGEETVIASNTSQFSISQLASVARNPERVIGMHWFNPPPLMRCIEVVRGMETNDKTLALALEM